MRRVLWLSVGLVGALLTGFSANAEPDAADWRVEAVALPDALAKTRTLAIASHGDDLLVITSIQSQMQLWRYADGEFIAVKFADDSPVTGSWLYAHVEGETAVVEVNQRGELRPTYAVIRNGRASLLRDADGKPVKNKDLYIFESFGHVMAALPEEHGSRRDDYFMLHDDTLLPMMLPNDEQLTAEIAYLQREPDGRLLMAALSGEGPVRRYLFEEMKLRVLPEIPVPDSLSVYDFEITPTYFGDRTVVAGIDRKAKVGRAWVVNNGEPRVVELAEGGSLKHATVACRHYGDGVYLRCGEEGAYFIYELDGHIARPVLLKDGELGTPLFAFGGDVPLFTNYRGGSDLSLWRLEGVIATEVKFKGGGSVTPTPSYEVEHIGARTIIRYITDKGEFAGLLRDNELIPLMPKEGFAASKLGAAVFECDGDLFILGENVTDEDTEWLGHIGPDFKSSALKTGDGAELEGAAITTVVIGNKIYISRNPYGPNPTLHLVRR